MFAEVPRKPLNSSNITVLKHGTDRQKSAYKCILSGDFFALLAEFRAVLASTIALGIDTPTSDLDFLCETDDLKYFTRQVCSHFGRREHFREVQTPCSETLRCYSFFYDEFEIEIFGSLEKLEEQLGYRHHVVIARLLAQGGEPFRSSLQNAKLHGIKTEPAIAGLLGLSGDPYESVACLASLDDTGLQRALTPFLLKSDLSLLVRNPLGKLTE